MRNNSGFTLMEMMIAIAIIGIMVVVAVPNMVTWQSNQRLSSAAREILSVMQLARVTAVKENASVEVKIDINNETYEVAMVLSGTVVRSGTMEADIDIVNCTEPDKKFIFNSRGIVADEGDVLLQNRKNRTKTIKVETSGRMRIE